MYTGMWRRPSCTPRVWPTMSGVIVLARAQVLTRRFSPLWFIRTIFSSRLASMYGPFFAERVIMSPLGPRAGDRRAPTPDPRQLTTVVLYRLPAGRGGGHE